MNAFVAVVVSVAVFEFGAAYLPLYVGRGQHRQLSPAARMRQMRARRVKGIRVHQPIPRQLLIADNYTVEAAGAAARRDRDDLLAGLGQIGQPTA